MASWLSRLAVALISLVAVACAGGIVLGAASAETEVTQLVATCLSCGEKWMFAPSASVSAGILGFLRLYREKADKCPVCSSRAVTFGHADHNTKAP